LEEPRREGAVHVEEEGVVPREAVAEGLREGEHPLAHGDARDDRGDEVVGAEAHAAAHARGAEAAALAREGNEELGAARGAGVAREASSQVAAPAELEELAPHEARERPPLAREARAEARKALAERLGEEAPRPIAGRVAGGHAARRDSRDDPGTGRP